MDEKVISTLANVFIAAVQEARDKGIDDLSISAAVGLALAKIGGTKAGVEHIAEFASKNLPTQH